MMEVLNNKMSEFSSIRILSQRPEQREFINVQDVSKDDFDMDKIFNTVSPALAFQYVSNNPPDLDSRVPDYFNNLNSWLGQTMQRDCGQVYCLMLKKAQDPLYVVKWGFSRGFCLIIKSDVMPAMSFPT